MSQWSPTWTSPRGGQSPKERSQQEIIEGHISEWDTHVIFILEMLFQVLSVIFVYDLYFWHVSRKYLLKSNEVEKIEYRETEKFQANANLKAVTRQKVIQA